MTPEQILAIKPKVLTQKQREFYFENGYIASPPPMPPGTSTKATPPPTLACAVSPA